MAKPTALGDFIRIIAQDHGEKALLDSQLTLAVFMDLAPNLKRERELLRSFLLCNGAEKLIHATKESFQDQEACINSIIKDLEEKQWLSKDAAHYICSEFYYGLTGQKWTFHIEDTSDLDVYRNITISNSDKFSRRTISVEVDAKTVTVPLPTDVSDGQIVRFSKKGKQDAVTGMAGDLYVTIHIAAVSKKPWPIFAIAAVVIVLLFAIAMAPRKENQVNKQNNDNTSSASQMQTTSHTHSWQSATCTKPKTCSTCGETSGSVAGHQWIDATYTAPKTCSVCRQTEGMSLGTPLNKCMVIEDSQSTAGTDIITGTLTDVAGKKHENAVMFWVSDARNYINIEHIVYGINSKYDILEGSISLGEDSASGAAVRFYIFGDGNLLYKSDYISGAQEKTLRIDVSGVSELRIECETDETCHCYGILTAMLYVN